MSGTYPTRPVICVDMGTTNTRGWLVHEGRVVASERVAADGKDTARTGVGTAIEQALSYVCSELERAGRRLGLLPTTAVAAGMITSPLGLVEVPHLRAPVGFQQLVAAAAMRCDVPEVTELPVVLVPGVRTAPSGDDTRAEDTNVMRGEETLCLGLLQQGRVEARSCVLNLGSHWKLIGLDDEGRVAWSETTLSGELVYGAWRDTILAGALPRDRPIELDPEWIDRGRAAMQERGLARALFCVRLLAQEAGSEAVDRLAFLYGVFLESDLRPWLLRQRLLPASAAVVVGPEAVARAWVDALAEHGIAVTVVGEVEAEASVVAGLQAVLAAAAVRLAV